MTAPRPAPERGSAPAYRQPHLPQLTQILYQLTGSVATITINRAERFNCLDYTTLSELSAAFRHCAFDDRVAVVVLTGAGERAFCTGADLDEHATWLKERPRDYHKWVTQFMETVERLRRLPKPTIARLNGNVVGGGNELQLACDLAVAPDDITIGQVGTARGSVPSMGATQWLPLAIGERRAREMVLTCRQVDAKTAFYWGLVNRVVARSELDTTVAQLAEQLIEKLPEVSRYAKVQLDFWREMSWSLTAHHARDWLTLHAGAPETHLGLDTFYARREIDYAGLRERIAAGESVEYPWGAPSRDCAACGAQGLPGEFSHCGRCGALL